jgi:hypothetical protein
MSKGEPDFTSQPDEWDEEEDREHSHSGERGTRKRRLKVGPSRLLSSKSRSCLVVGQNTGREPPVQVLQGQRYNGTRPRKSWTCGRYVRTRGSQCWGPYPCTCTLTRTYADQARSAETLTEPRARVGQSGRRVAMDAVVFLYSILGTSGTS